MMARGRTIVGGVLRRRRVVSDGAQFQHCKTAVFRSNWIGPDPK